MLFINHKGHHAIEGGRERDQDYSTNNLADRLVLTAKTELL